MQSISHVWVFLAALALSGCGGGNTSLPVPEPVACNSGLLWAVPPPASSGSSIPDGSSTGLTLQWNNISCATQTLQKVTISVCLNHPRPEDLAWSLIPPSSAAVNLTAPANWNSGASCDQGKGKLQSFNWTPNGLQSLTPQSLWRLRVVDNQASDAGQLIQWQLTIEGTR